MMVVLLLLLETASCMDPNAVSCDGGVSVEIDGEDGEDGVNSGVSCLSNVAAPLCLSLPARARLSCPAMARSARRGQSCEGGYA